MLFALGAGSVGFWAYGRTSGCTLPHVREHDVQLLARALSRGPRNAFAGSWRGRCNAPLMVNPVVRGAASVLLGLALCVAPEVARADDDADEPSTPQSIEDYQEALAEQERQVRISRGAAAVSARARLDKLRANYERDTRSYSFETTVAGVVLTVLGAAGTVFGLVAEAGSKSSASWDTSGLGVLVFAVPSLLGGVVPGVIMISVGTQPVLRHPPRAPRVTLSLGVGALSGTF